MRRVRAYSQLKGTEKGSFSDRRVRFSYFLSMS